MAIVCLCFASTKAQDTIVMRDGHKIIAQNIYIQNKLYYRNYKDTAEVWYSKNQSEVAYIAYDNNNITYFTDSAKKSRIRKLTDISFFINVFGGYPDFITMNMNSYYSYSYTNEVVNIPYIGFLVDCKVDKHITIGAGFGSQVISWNEPNYNVYPNTTNTVQQKSQNISLRALYHIDLFKTCQAYAGVGYGIVYNITTTYSDGQSPEADNTSIPGYQIFAGFNALFIKNFGIHIEAAYGTPYLVEGGLTYRLSFNIHNPE